MEYNVWMYSEAFGWDCFTQESFQEAIACVERLHSKCVSLNDGIERKWSIEPKPAFDDDEDVFWRHSGSTKDLDDAHQRQEELAKDIRVVVTPFRATRLSDESAAQLVPGDGLTDFSEHFHGPSSIDFNSAHGRRTSEYGRCILPDGKRSKPGRWCKAALPAHF